LSALEAIFDDLPTNLNILDYIKCVFRTGWLKALL